MSDMPFDLPDDEEDIAEQAEIVGKLTPREYAKLRNIAPQTVYYWIRNNKLETEHCVCGRRIIDVKAADGVLSQTAKARGQVLDSGPVGYTKYGFEEVVSGL